MYNIYWQLDGNQCTATAETKEEAKEYCMALESGGIYDEIYFEEA